MPLQFFDHKPRQGYRLQARSRLGPAQRYHCGSPLTMRLHHFYLVSHTQGCDTTTAWSRPSHHPRAVEARNLVTSVDWSTACRLRSQWSSSAAGMGLDMK